MKSDLGRGTPDPCRGPAGTKLDRFSCSNAKQGGCVVNEVQLRQCESILNSDPFKEIHLIWIQYLQYLLFENGPLSCFWMSYIDIVGDVLLGLIRASREGNWQLHLYAIRNMIPWCFAYDKINYARYLPVYYAQMINIPSEHPNVYSNFMNGRFSVQLAGESPFGCPDCALKRQAIPQLGRS